MTTWKRWIPHSLAISLFTALTAVVLTYSPAAASDPCDIVCRSYELCEIEEEACQPVGNPPRYCWGTHITCEVAGWCDDTECEF